MTRVAFGADHAGFQLKNQLFELAVEMQLEVVDLGVNSQESVDYPDQAVLVCQSIITGNAEMGLLVCGSGVGVSIAANRYPEIRAALCHSETESRLSRQHNDANVLCLGERLIGASIAKEAFRVFFTTQFEGGRHVNRVKKLDTTAE